VLEREAKIAVSSSNFDSDVLFSEPSPGTPRFNDINALTPGVRYTNFGPTESLWTAMERISSVSNPPGRLHCVHLSSKLTRALTIGSQQAYAPTARRSRSTAPDVLQVTPDMLMGYIVPCRAVSPPL